MNTTNLPPGVYIDSIAPLAPLPIERTGTIVFAVRFQISIPDQQEVSFEIQVLAHDLDQAAQIAYAKMATALASLAKIANEASDALIAKLGKP